MFIRASIISGLFTNLAAGSFGIVIFTPPFLSGRTYLEILMYVIRFIFMGFSFLLTAELVERGGEESGVK